MKDKHAGRKMTETGKKLQTILLILGLAVCLMPLRARTVNAADPVLYVGGVQVIGDGVITGFPEGVVNGTASYNSGTLTLTDFKFQGDAYADSGIYSEGNLNIILKGSSRITETVNGDNESYGIRVTNGNLSITGDPGSKLELIPGAGSGSSYGIWVENGSLSITGNPDNKLELHSAGAESGFSRAIWLSGNSGSRNFSISGAKVTAAASPNANGSVGLQIDGGLSSFTVSNGGSLDASGKQYGISANLNGQMQLTGSQVTATALGGTGAASTGLYLNGSNANLTLQSSSTLTARGGSATGNSSSGIQINATTGSILSEGNSIIDAAGGAVTGTGSKSYGINIGTGSLTAKNSQITSSGKPAGDSSYGLYMSSDALTASSSKLVFEGSNAGSNSMGIWCGSVSSSGSGSTLKATGGNASKSYGIYADSGSVLADNGSLTASAGTGTYSYGIYAEPGSVQADHGSSLTASAGTGSTASAGIYAKTGNILAKDSSNLSASGGNSNQYSYGVNAGGALTVEGGSRLSAAAGTGGSASYGLIVNASSLDVNGILETKGYTYAAASFQSGFSITAGSIMAGGKYSGAGATAVTEKNAGGRAILKNAFSDKYRYIITNPTAIDIQKIAEATANEGGSGGEDNPGGSGSNSGSGGSGITGDVSTPTSPGHNTTGENVSSISQNSSKYVYVAKQSSALIAYVPVDIKEYFADHVKAEGYDLTAKHRFYSSNKKLAKVTKKGILTPKKRGEVDVMLQQKVKGGSWVQVGAAVHFYIQQPEMVKKETFLASPGSTLNASKFLSKTTYAPTMWISSKPSVATVDPNTGVITINKKGTFNLIALYGEGKRTSKKRYKTKIKIKAMLAL